MSQADLDQFVQTVLQGAAVQELLWQTRDIDTFVELAQQLGAKQGYNFTRADIKATLYIPRRGWHEQATITTTHIDLTGWMPIRVIDRNDQVLIEWCYLGQRRFTEPFFEHTILDCLRHPFNLLIRVLTPIETLTELHAAQPGRSPSGFIFHMSRCGSTLIAQLLAALPQAIVIAEAEPIDGVLRTNRRNSAISDDQRCAWLHQVVSALGRPRAAAEQHLFVKFDSWNIVDMPLIRRAYPHVPWVFVFRDPVEVMVSHQQLRGSQMIPGVLEPAMVGLDQSEILKLSLDEYCARMLGRICGDAVQYGATNSDGLFVHYRQLPEFVWSNLLDYFGITASHDDIERMRQVAQFHAKRPHEQFVDDSRAKQQIASDYVRGLADQWVQPHYERLVELQASNRLSKTR